MTSIDHGPSATGTWGLEAVREPAVRAAEQAADLIQAEIKPRLRGWLHAATAPFAFLSVLVLLVLADSTSVRIGVAVFMVSALALFTTSAIYHTGTWSAEQMRMLKRIDHANIFVLIAGTTTPLAILLLTEQHARILLGLMWGGALLGVVFKICWVDAPRWLHVPLYLVLGWTPIVFAADFLDGGITTGLVLVGVGGAFYTAGALVYGVRRPDPLPHLFGYHEVFHSLTVAAFAAHYLGISLLVYAPTP